METFIQTVSLFVWFAVMIFVCMTLPSIACVAVGIVLGTTLCTSQGGILNFINTSFTHIKRIKRG